MGFRNPITSASAVDTRPAAGAAGVRIYQQDVPGLPGQVQGVVEIDDGQGGDPAQFVVIPGEPTGHSVNGGVTELAGGSFPVGIGGYMTAPTLQENVEINSDTGGWQPVMRLKAGAGGRIVADNALDVLQQGGISWAAGYIADYGGAYAKSEVRLTASGMVVLSGVIRNVNASTIIAGSQIGTIPSWATPTSGTVILHLNTGTSGGAVRVDVTTAGALRLQTALASGADVSITSTYPLN